MTHPLTNYRKQNDLTLAEFGEMIDVPKGTISRWENCHALPRRDALDKINVATGGLVSPDAMWRAYYNNTVGGTLQTSLTPEPAE